MKKLIAAAALFFVCVQMFGQTSDDIISKVIMAQQQLKTVAYTLQRIDTFVTGDTRITNGQVKMLAAAEDKVFGCWFWAKRDDINKATVYDGVKSVEIDEDKKEYTVNTNAKQFPYILGAPGGQMLLPDLIKLDTTKNTGFTLAEDQQYYYLTKHMPDLKEYDVSKRYTVFSIDKKLMLPLRMRSHQETLGKVQDLDYIVKDIWINDEAHAYDFSHPYFATGYTMVIDPMSQAPKPSKLLHKPAPPFQLTAMTEELVKSQQLKGKVVLLDFLEVWCGPCFASVPKIQVISDKYKNKGLQVYGVSFEKKQLDAMKKMIEKFKVDFPVLIGEEETRTAYEVDAIPRYIVINRKGEVSFSSIGFFRKFGKRNCKSVGGLI